MAELQGGLWTGRAGMEHPLCVQQGQFLLLGADAL